MDSGMKQEFTGGVRLNGFNASYPFAKFSADAEKLEISCLGRIYVFPKNSIKRLSRHRGLFSVGLRVEHNESNYPGFVIFWTDPFFFGAGFRRLRAALEGLGYAVADSKS